MNTQAAQALVCEEVVMRPTVLFVDDEPLILRALGRMFRQEALDLHFAGDVVEALRVVAEVRVDVIVSDYRMPGLVGTELFRRARQAGCTAVGILLTGQADEDAVRCALDEGLVDVIVRKPWRDALLRATVLRAAKCSPLGPNRVARGQ